PLVEMIDASVQRASTSFSPRLRRPRLVGYALRLDSANSVQLWDSSTKPAGESSVTRTVACGTPSSGSSTISTRLVPSASSALEISSKMRAILPRRSMSFASPLRSISNQFLSLLMLTSRCGADFARQSALCEWASALFDEQLRQEQRHTGLQTLSC